MTVVSQDRHARSFEFPYARMGGHVEAALHAEQAADDRGLGDGSCGQATLRRSRRGAGKGFGTIMVVLEDVEAWAEPVITVMA
ncbi:hypothetical protein ARC20_10140 [Stenotrophomonas panacihumi]|uniref:Uncharacterized protein n=1 Tax=Stenotrophomonas panacihumi TaxID=676599 RepID=A0A0R0AQ82_9GAMM|nr:hypothetical protein ARC20_10140 [Stenotrophomonas panacihumi]